MKLLQLIFCISFFFPLPNSYIKLNTKIINQQDSSIQNQVSKKILKMIPAKTTSDGTVLIKEEDILYPKNSFVIFEKTGLNKVKSIGLKSEFIESGSWYYTIDIHEIDIIDKKTTEYFLSLNNDDPVRVEYMRNDKTIVFSYNYKKGKDEFMDRLICYY